MRTLADGIAAGFGASAALEWLAGPPALVNSPEWADFALQQAEACGYRAQQAAPVMGGEDFAFYLHHVPGAFVSIGSASAFGLHHPAFDPGEAAIAPAADYFSRLAQAALKKLAADKKP